MTGIRIQYIWLELRKWFYYMRRRLLGLGFVFLLLGLLLGGCYLRISDKEQDSMVRVALVIPGEQEELMQLAQMLQHMDSVRSIITFVYPDESEIDEMFEAGDIQAAILW